MPTAKIKRRGTYVETNSFGNLKNKNLKNFIENSNAFYLHFSLYELTISFFEHDDLTFAIDASICRLDSKGGKIPNDKIDQF